MGDQTLMALAPAHTAMATFAAMSAAPGARAAAGAAVGPAVAWEAWRTERSIVCAPPLPPWGTYAAATALVIVATAVIVGYMRARHTRALVALRLMQLLLMGVLLGRPALQVRQVRRVMDRIAIIVDDSASMSLQLAPEQSRWQRLVALMQQAQPALADLAGKHRLQFFGLHGPHALDALATISPTGEATDLLAALELTRDADPGEPLAGIVLMSDGGDTVHYPRPAERDAPAAGDQDASISPGDANRRPAGPTGQAVRASKQPFEPLPTAAEPQAFVQARLQALGVPVNVIDITAGAPPYVDVAITDVHADTMAFVHNTFGVDVEILASGLATATDDIVVPVSLRQGHKLWATQSVHLRHNRPGRVSFHIKPDEQGSFIFTVSVPPQPGEATLANNVMHLAVQVVRDKVRVLQVSGRPSWDERFLRQMLKESPSADLVSFFILRTPQSDASVPESELSLIPFPVNKLFTSELKNFDVVIFQNFDFRPYHMAQYLPNIRDAVQEGLGFVMLGGDASFQDGGFAGTAIEAILPVQLGTQPMQARSIMPQLTEAGLHHPITDLAPPGQSRREALARLPPWSGANPLAGVAPGATALAIDPGRRGTDGAPAVLIAAMDVGKGRSVAVATDAIWRWQFAPAVPSSGSHRAYARFWSTVLRWLVRDPEHARVRVTTDASRYRTTQPVQVDVAALSRDYGPEPNARIDLRLTAAQSVSAMAATTTAHHVALLANQEGTARATFESLPPGPYALDVHAEITGIGPTSATAAFVVQGISDDLRDGAPRPEVLAHLAHATGGALLPPDPKSFAQLTFAGPNLVETGHRGLVPLWDNAFVLGAFVLCFALEWWLRRRRGFA